MDKKILCLLLAFFMGCSTLPPWAKGGSRQAKVPPGFSHPKTIAGKAVADQKDLGAVQEIPTGTIFAKTVFDGVVKTSYVRLSIMDQDDADKSYQLYIGDKARQKNLPWKIQTVNPGYFFIELPPGRYQINTISIPVGTALATEPMDITFEVTAKKTTYLGTLTVQGTKERIRFGGVPVIKPGFEYRAVFQDQREEAFRELRERFPELKGEIAVHFMKINRDGNVENPPPEDLTADP